MLEPESFAPTLTRGSTVTLSDQLVAYLREQILTSRFAEHDRLPPTRTLATHLRVSRSVVVRAYDQLVGEGYLDARQGSATTVAAGIVPVAAPAVETTASPASPVGHATVCRPDTPVRSSPTMIDLTTGHPFAPATPPVEWRRALAAAGRYPTTPYAPDPCGTPDLREQIAGHLRRARGIPCTPDDVIVTAGTSDALLLIALTLGHDRGPGTRIAVEDPGYPAASRILGRAGAVPVSVPVDADGMTVALLTRYARDTAAVLLTPGHQYPLGGRIPAGERTALIAWAQAHGALLVEDDYDSEFRHAGAALPAIAALDPGGVVVHVGSFNKSFSPSLRCGYIVATAGSPVWDALTGTKQALDANVSATTQFALARFIATGGFHRYIARTRREYGHRRTLLLDRFAAHGLGDRVSGTDGGLQAILRLPAHLSGAGVARRLAARGVLVQPLSHFTQLSRADDAIAIGYGAEPVSRLLHGIDRIARVVRSPRTRRAVGKSGYTTDP